MKNRLYNIIRKRGLEKLRANIILTTQWFDIKGKPTSREKVSDSLLGNFILMMFINYAGTNASGNANWPLLVPPYTTSGAGATVWANDTASSTGSIPTSYPQVMNAAAGSTAYGILYSTDTTSPGVSDSVPSGIIANGNGAGQLVYSIQQASSGPGYVGNTASFSLYRAVTNSSGAAITINKVYIATKANSLYYLIFEELNNHTINDASTEGLRITFTVTV